MFDEHQVNDTNLNPELRKLEVELSRIALPASRVDRDWVLFESGRAAALAEMNRDVVRPVLPTGRPVPRGVWPAVSIVGTVATVFMGVLLFQEMQSVRRLSDQLSRVEQATIHLDAEPETPALVGDSSQPDRSTVQTEKDGAPNELRERDLDFDRRSVDLVERVLNWPRGQVMTAGLVLPGPRSSDRRASDFFHDEPNNLGPVRVRPRKTHREMFNELLSEFEMSGA